jgi:hypothetical protein
MWKVKQKQKTNKMEKNTKILLGIGAIAVAGYLLMKPKKKPFLGEFRLLRERNNRLAGMIQAARSRRLEYMNKYAEAFGRPPVAGAGLPQLAVISAQEYCAQGGTQVGEAYKGYKFYSVGGQVAWGCDAQGNKLSVAQLQAANILN